MPNNTKCVRAYLAANAFIQQPGIKEYVRISDVISYMNCFCHEGQEAIVAVRGASTEYILISSKFSSSTESGDASRYQAYGYRNPAYRTDISDIWVRWQDRKDHSPIKRKCRAPKPRKPFELPTSHTIFYPYQKNPKESTGDCVIRAIASACDLSWEETIDSLAEVSNYTSTTLNSPEVFEMYLKQSGFKKHPTLTRSGSKLTGSAFCNEMDNLLHQGEIIFAYVGRSHVAAILPFNENDIVHYKIVDSWDSTSRKIGEYWIKPVPVNDATSAAKEKCSVGSVIVHPVFGRGRVIDLHASGWATVLFSQHGKRRLDIRWILQNCDHSDVTG